MHHDRGAARCEREVRGAIQGLDARRPRRNGSRRRLRGVRARGEDDGGDGSEGRECEVKRVERADDASSVALAVGGVKEPCRLPACPAADPGCSLW
jgi:hypothetical protein